MNDFFSSIAAWAMNIGNGLQNAFIEKDRWKYLVSGLGTTLQITLFACLLGIVLGVVIAIVRTSHDKNIASMQKGLPRFLLKLFNKISKLYLTVIRGTPVVIQLLIMAFVIFATSDISAVFVAVLTFGINSGAYVAEIIRSGIMSIDPGQFEAGRSLGFNYVQTMRHIILPQAFKNVLPALANEFIVLLKKPPSPVMWPLWILPKQAT